MDFIIPSPGIAFPAVPPAETGRGHVLLTCMRRDQCPTLVPWGGSCLAGFLRVLQAGPSAGQFGKLWSSRESTGLKERLRTDGKSRQELGFDGCQDISWKFPCFAGCPALLPFPCSPPAGPGDIWKWEQREGQRSHTAPAQVTSARAQSCHLTCGEHTCMGVPPLTFPP